MYCELNNDLARGLLDLRSELTLLLLLLLEWEREVIGTGTDYGAVIGLNLPLKIRSTVKPLI